MGEEGVTGDVQKAANEALDGVTAVANSVYDLGEAELKRVVSTLVAIVDAAGSALKAVVGKATGQ